MERENIEGKIIVELIIAGGGKHREGNSRGAHHGWKGKTQRVE